MYLMFVYRYLNREKLHESFQELYFMPDIPQLAEVNAVLKNYMVYSGRPDAFPLQLKQYLSGIQHDNMEVCKQVGKSIVIFPLTMKM